ncbi:MAG TPA: serine protein kinase PrkA [Polyangiaceae bacterium]|nr:serine protein kinase PrkA [Polyangiaceae bacterium]
MAERGILSRLDDISRQVQKEFHEGQRVLSFQEYLALVAAHPARHTRDAARYLRDAFDHFGRVVLKRPAGEVTRFKLFDLPWLPEADAQRHALVGQERVQEEIYRTLSNFVQEGRPNRLPLLHGPNGSAKSTAAQCMMAALEHYSTLEEGALYRFHWVFPSKNTVKGAIGFAERAQGRSTPGEGYAHLPDDAVDARLFVEVRDHPLFLLPEIQRERLVEALFQEHELEAAPSEWVFRGRLSHKNRQVFDALLASYDGNLDEVLRHVQVERYFISKRYRTGAVTVGPQLSVDAGERQLTADRNLASLPPMLQSITLFEAFGELIDASGGILEFSDLLKRPLDAFKYLQLTVETGEVPLRSQTVQVNTVMVGSANEAQLAAFREHPEFESFRGRLELIRMPYLLRYSDEQRIYDSQIVPQARVHVAPHATKIAAMFAVLSRLRRPNPDRYEKPLSDVVREVSVLDKLDLYDSARVPDRFDDESAKRLRNCIEQMFEESASYPIYEGSIGASPREMRTVLLDAAQDERYDCLSPFAVLDELDELCKKDSEYIWLQQDAQPGGYHDHASFRKALRVRLLDMIEDEFRVASGLVDDRRYKELFDRYIVHVGNWVKGEKVRNPVTGAAEDPDIRLMEEVEARLAYPDPPEEVRRALVSQIAGYVISHPDEPLDNDRVFSAQVKRLRDAVFTEKRPAVAKLCRDVVVLVRGEGTGLAESRRAEVRAMLDRLVAAAGYNESSAADAAAALARERFSDVLR